MKPNQNNSIRFDLILFDLIWSDLIWIELDWSWCVLDSFVFGQVLSDLLIFYISVYWFSLSWYLNLIWSFPNLVGKVCKSVMFGNSLSLAKTGIFLLKWLKILDFDFDFVSDLISSWFSINIKRNNEMAYWSVFVGHLMFLQCFHLVTWFVGQIHQNHSKIL